MKEKGLSLYEITAAYSKLEEMLEEGDNTLLTEYLDSVEVQLQDKARGIIGFMRNIELTSDSVALEIKRLQSYQKSLDAKNEALRNYIAYAMIKNNIDKIETDIGRLSFRKSSSVEIDDLDSLPEQYIVTKTTTAPDKIMIKKDFEKGIDIPGAHIEEKKNLQVK